MVKGQKSRDGGDMLVVRRKYGAGNGVTKIFNLDGTKNTLLEVDGEAVEAAEVKHTLEV